MLDMSPNVPSFCPRYIEPIAAQVSSSRKNPNYFLIALRAFLRYLARMDIETLSVEKIELGEQEASPLKVLDQDLEDFSKEMSENF